MNFHSYRLWISENANNSLLGYEKLFYQFISNMFAKTKSNCFSFLKLNRFKLRTSSYPTKKDSNGLWIYLKCFAVQTNLGGLG